MNVSRTFSYALFILFTLLVTGSLTASAEPGRWETEVSGTNWRLWLDREADWENDTVFMPPVDIAKLPVNPPSGGWEKLAGSPGKAVSVPGTVEEYFWDANGNPVGEAGDYRGVSW